MAHQKDFEVYALEKSMEANISPSWISMFENKIFPNISPVKANVRILDYGFGDGRYYDFFCRYFIKDNIYGVEVSIIRLQRAVEKGFLNVYCIDKGERLPFKDDFFDFINLHQVLEHISFKETAFCLEEVRRVLKPEGIIFVVVPNYPIKRLYDLRMAFLTKDLKRIKDDPTHVCFYNFRKLKFTLNKYFSKVTLIPTGGEFFNIFKSNFFSHKIFAIAKK